MQLLKDLGMRAEFSRCFNLFAPYRSTENLDFLKQGLTIYVDICLKT